MSLSSLLNLIQLSFSRTCKRVDQEALSEEEMVEIEKDLKRRRKLLERKCQQLERSLPKPKKDVSHLRYPEVSCIETPTIGMIFRLTIHQCC